MSLTCTSHFADINPLGGDFCAAHEVGLLDQQAEVILRLSSAGRSYARPWAQVIIRLHCYLIAADFGNAEEPWRRQPRAKPSHDAVPDTHESKRVTHVSVAENINLLHKFGYM